MEDLVSRDKVTDYLNGRKFHLVVKDGQELYISEEEFIEYNEKAKETRDGKRK
jgi:peptidase E